MKKTNLLTIALILIFNFSNSQSISWGTGMNINTSTSGNDHPRITIDRNGNPLVLWHNASRAMFSRWSGTAFTSPVMINPMPVTIAGASWMGPDIASFGDTVYVVYKQMPEGDDTSNIFCVHSYNGGMAWSSPVQVDNIADSISRFPSVTVDASGNPIVAFMKMDAGYGDARWVVAKSSDYGASFSMDIKASGWSSVASTVCDCCPGAIVCNSNKVAMLYRDVNGMTRDSWAGVSTNTGASFTGGVNIDQQNWMLMSCPSTGPDGVIIGDTLFSVFASASSGDYRTYLSKTSLSGMSSTGGTLLTGAIAGLIGQNYPRIASSGNAVAIAWKQDIGGSDYLALQFTNNINSGSTFTTDTVDMNNITTCDVALDNGKILIVWEDDGSNTVKYRSGTYATSSIGINETTNKNNFKVYPTPTQNLIFVESKNNSNIKEINVVDALGRNLFSKKHFNSSIASIDISSLVSGIYFLNIVSSEETFYQKIIKQ